MAFHPTNRGTDYLLPPPVQEWLPEAHLARHAVDVVEGSDLSSLVRACAGCGSGAYDPATPPSLSIHGYATGTFSSREIGRATCDSPAFRHIACNRHPDHGTPATFRKRFGQEFQPAFVQVLEVAGENQLPRFGTASLGGTKIRANAGRHSALPYGHAEKTEARLKAEVRELPALAEAADQSSVPDGAGPPDEIERREDRLAAIAAAKAKIEARAKERHERAQAEHEGKMAARAKKEAETGKKPGGKPPKPPEAGPRADGQTHLADEESRIMKVAGGGFERCFNAQAPADTGSVLALAPHVGRDTNDEQQAAPMAEEMQTNPEGFDRPNILLADTGYFGEKNVETCVVAKITPLIAVKRDERHPEWRDRFTEPDALPDDASSVDLMKHSLKAKDGRAAYALRKQTVEPVFGIIKSVAGFRQSLLRGLENVRNEWAPVCLAWNLKRMAVLRPQ